MTPVLDFIVATSAAVTATAAVLVVRELHRLVSTVEMNDRRASLHRAILRRLTSRPLPRSMTAEEYRKHTENRDERPKNT